jgi:hypothetical protein
MRYKISYIAYVKNHKDSSGNLAEWTIKDHSTDKILSSFPTKEKAQAHLQQMHIHKGKSIMEFRNVKNIDELMKDY